MATKIIIVLFASVILVAAQEDCTCEDEKTLNEATDIFKFLNVLSADPENDKYPILPALLSPLVPCGNCIENSRKKRKIFPEPAENNSEIKKEEDENNMADEDSDETHPFPAHAGIRNKCPLGFVRIGFMCLSADLL
ncbi:unnamed protein product [Parnassius apollo]|uniref:(apollo) hypothetical protein n=1 Tax=Parnassius apollo TaxID=110799 RepID=A0A8S3YDU9_PARAO|nr:unnamed protein product [Parnassius apollo]